jgi:SNF2 family DNA or RNA helicase
MTASGTKSLRETLKPASYQLVPLAKLLANRVGCVLIADGVGVGKTISAAYILVYSVAKFHKPALVVCGPTLLAKWIFELRSKFDIDAIPIRSLDDLETAREETAHRPGESSKQPAYIMSSSVLLRASRGSYPPISAVAFDEIHNYRNSKTQSFKGCLELARASTFRVGLSATPINNSLDDLVSEFSILLPSYNYDAVHATVNEVWTSRRELLTNGFATRFLKDKLGIHFAKRDLSSIYVSYPDSYIQKAKRAISERSSYGTLLEQITYYRLAASSPWAFWTSMDRREERDQADPKLEALLKILQDTTITHWLVFCEFTGTAELLSERIDIPGGTSVFTITGETPMFERPSVVETFRSSPRGVMVLTSVGSEGLDFQFCGGIVNYDLHWNPMKLEQRAGRIDRLGQKKDTIRIVNLHVKNSIDERVVAVIHRKLDIVSSSVFAPGPLLARQGSETVSNGIYDEEALARELEAGESLVETFGFNKEIETHDYLALPKVNVDLCEPFKIQEMAERITPEMVVADENWQNDVSDSSQAIVRLLKYYA